MNTFKSILFVAVLSLGIGTYAEDQKEDFKSMIKNAKTIFNAHKYGDAEKAFNKTIKAATNVDEQAVCLLYMGKCMQHQKKYDQAIKNFYKIMELDTSVKLQYQTSQSLGLLLSNLGKYEEAIKVIKIGLGLKGLNSKQKVYLQYLLGTLQVKFKKDEEALKTFTSLVNNKKASSRWRAVGYSRVFDIKKRDKDIPGALEACNKLIMIENAPTHLKKAAQEFINKHKSKSEK